MQTSVKERLIQFIKWNKISVNKFEQNCGLSTSYVANMRKSLRDDKIAKIRKIYPELNIDWLLTGEGDMIVESLDVTLPADKPQGYAVPLVPISVRGGTLTGFAQEGVGLRDCEYIYSPIDADFVISVRDESMSPEYPNGSRVFVKKINPDAFIEWGKVYALSTCNGDILKEVRRSDVEGCICCHSLNPDPKYAPFEVRLNDIHGWFRVLMCLCMK